MSDPYGPQQGQQHGTPQQYPPIQQPYGGYPHQPDQGTPHGPQPYGYQQQGYGQPQMVPPPPQQASASHNGAGILALVFGIIAFVASFVPDGWRIGFVLGIVALIAGFAGRTRAKHGIASNKGLSTAGLVLGVLAAAGSFYMMATFGS